MRIHRSIWQRLVYSAIYECKQCKHRKPARRKFTFEFTRHVSCPRCGNQDLGVLPRRDRIERFYNSPISRAQGLFGAKLYHCVFCRLQFYDLRALADPETLEKSELQFARPRDPEGFKKEQDAVMPAVSPEPPVQENPPAPEANAAAAPAIGKGVVVTGRVSGLGDLYVDGEVDGCIELNGHNLTVGPNAKIRAKITARTLTLLGTSVGDVEVTEKITVKKAARLTGNIRAVDITIEDGAYFRGSIDLIKTGATEAAPHAPSGSSGRETTPSRSHPGKTFTERY